MNLKRKGENILGVAFKTIMFFIVLGMIALFVAVHFVEHMLGELTNAVNPAPAKNEEKPTSK